MSTKQRSALSYMTIPGAAAIAAVGAAGYFAGPAMALSVALLIILEISLSFDNAVVNAHVLQNWDEFWKKMFLGVGIIIAVFGMRFLFPILIVSITAQLSIPDTVHLALSDHDGYAKRLNEVHYLIAAFGGSFLAMVGLTYFLDAEKDSHWLGPVERLLTKAGQIEAIAVGVALLPLLFVCSWLVEHEQLGFLMAGVMGILTFIGSKALGTIATGGEDVGDKVVKAGLGGFLYLELLDASFSFDGVIGAFAITTDLVWIMVGLGVGALAVRELTILAVDRGTLQEYPHLEMGAFWAILALAGIMLVSPVFPIPEYITGLIGAIMIGAAFITSLIANRKVIEETMEAK